MEGVVHHRTTQLLRVPPSGLGSALSCICFLASKFACCFFLPDLRLAFLHAPVSPCGVLDGRRDSVLLSFSD